MKKREGQEAREKEEKQLLIQHIFECWSGKLIKDR